MSLCVLGRVGGGMRLLGGATSAECSWGVSRSPRLPILPGAGKSATKTSYGVFICLVIES